MKLAAHLQQSKLLYLQQSNENLSVAENKHYRWLQFDNVVQSIMLKRVPSKLTIPHQYYLMLPLLYSRPVKIVELGLGGGNLVRFLKKKFPQVSIVSIERNQEVIECFQYYFNPENIHHLIINSTFELWLIKQKKHFCDWLIYDIYQTGKDPLNFINQISAIMKKMTRSSWLSVNLPDVNEHELNIILLHLSSIKKNRTMHYFQIPSYKNIIIHLCPENFELIELSTALPKHLYSRGSSLWQHGMVNR